MSAVLCPDCGLPMVWMGGRWRCQCRKVVAETRNGARMELQAIIWLPEEVPAEGRERWDVAEAVLAQQGLRVSERDGNRWLYHPDLHACAVLVELVKQGEIYRLVYCSIRTRGAWVRQSGWDVEELVDLADEEQGEYDSCYIETEAGRPVWEPTFGWIGEKAA